MTGESRDTRVKRLRIRAWRRGIKEMDLILGGWADAHLPAADDATLDRFEAVLAEADGDLFEWVSGQRRPPAHLAPFLARLAADFAPPPR